MAFFHKSLNELSPLFKQIAADAKKFSLNEVLINKLTELSVSDNWEEAKHEWRATGNVFNPKLSELPEPHCNNHPNFCLCGHPIIWHYEIENTKNGTLEILGSIHISRYMAFKHLSEIKRISINAITEEKLDKWPEEVVKPAKAKLKAKIWWEKNGDEWKKYLMELKI